MSPQVSLQQQQLSAFPDVGWVSAHTMPCWGKHRDLQSPYALCLYTDPYTLALIRGSAWNSLQAATENSCYVDDIPLCHQPEEGVWDVSRSEFPRSCGAFNCVAPFRVNGTINLYINSKMCAVGSTNLTRTTVVSPVPSYTICYGDVIATHHSSQWLS